MSDPVLILGNGFVGTEVADLCRSSGISCVLAGRKECDLLHAQATRSYISALHPRAVVLTAAIVRLKENSENSMLANAAMAKNVADASHAVPHVIFLSSIDVYGNQDLGVLTTSSRLSPFDPYGRSKEIGEEAILSRRVSSGAGLTTLLRLTGVYGPRDRGLSAISRMIQAARGGEITLTGTGSTRRDFLYGPDLARVILQSIQDPVTGVHNVARGKSQTMSEVAEAVRAIVNPVANISYKPAAPGNRDYDLVFDQAAFYQAFSGFSFSPFDDTLRVYAN